MFFHIGLQRQMLPQDTVLISDLPYEEGHRQRVEVLVHEQGVQRGTPVPRLLPTGAA